MGTIAPSNPCSGAGNAPAPSYYANQEQSDRNNLTEERFAALNDIH